MRKWIRRAGVLFMALWALPLGVLGGIITGAIDAIDGFPEAFMNDWNKE